MDRWWAPHDGIIPGSHLSLPFVAPFDHIVDLEGCAPHPQPPPAEPEAETLCLNPKDHAIDLEECALLLLPLG